MKTSATYLGHALQLFLLNNGHQLDELAKQLHITSEGLSNLIHGRRRFKDDTLQRLSETPLLCNAGFSLQRLKALRAMDEYRFDELILAVLEYIKSGEVARLPEDFFSGFQKEIDQTAFPPDFLDKKRALLELVQTTSM